MKKTTLIFFVIIAFLFTISPVIIRFANNSTIPGNAPYFYLVQANSINSFSDLFKKEFYTIQLYLFSLILGLETASKIVPISLALFSLALLHSTLTAILPTHLSFFITSSFILSPIFVSVSFFSTINSLLFFLLSASFYSIAKDKTFWTVLLVILLSFLNFLSAIFLFFGFLFLYLFFKKKYHSHLLAYITLIVVFYHLPFTYYLFLNPFQLNLSNLFVDFGSSFGISSFIFLLGLIGLFSCWYFHKKYLICYIFCLSVIFLSFFNSEIIFFSGIILSAFTGYALHLIYMRNWELSFIKNTSLLVLFCGLFFSTISFIFTASSALPNEDMKNGFFWLSSFDLSDSFIFSSPSNGWWIEYYSSNPTLLKKDSLNSDQIFKEILGTNDIFMTKKLLDSNSISFLIITKDMYDNFSRKEGLLFLLKDSETFKRVYSNRQLEIWEYKK